MSQMITVYGEEEIDELFKPFPTAFKIADELSDMILFHKEVKENGIKMMQP